MDSQERFFLMEKELVFGILDDLYVPLTQEKGCDPEGAHRVVLGFPRLLSRAGLRGQGDV